MDRTMHPKHQNRIRHLVSVLILSGISVILLALFYITYHGARQNLLHVWENNILQLAKSTEYYLARPADVIEFSAIQVESMMAQGVSNAAVGEYLVREMEHYAALVENNYTGVYGYCRGEYLDASGWVPEPDYQPTQRPWYLAAKENAGKVTLVSPFLNLQTGEKMMSVSKLLSDGESVLSIDIYMDGLQQTLEELAAMEEVNAAFILDNQGTVVAHSDRTQIGMSYPREGNQYQRQLSDWAGEVAATKGYSMPIPGRREILFAEPIDGAWCAVLLLDQVTLVHSLRFLNLIVILVLLLALGAWFGIARSVDHKYQEAERLSREVSAVADIYEAMSLVDLTTGRMTVLRGNDHLNRLLGGDFTDFSSRYDYIARQIAAVEWQKVLVRFLDPSTFQQRLQDVHSLSFDFRSAAEHWLRIQLIAVDRDEHGTLLNVIWAVESIDEERRQQEYLRTLAETDELTGLRNRRSGVSGVQAMLSQGRPGMFLLLDIDRFKSINDTFGHDTGDLVLQAVSDCLRRTFRDDDIVFRLGGDEFAVYVSGAAQQEVGERIVARLQEELRRIRLPERMDRSVSVSVGAAFYLGGKGDSFEDLYQRADQRMYGMKRQRRGEPE